MSNRQDDALPELPEPYDVVELWGQNVSVYCAGQMRAYAQSAIASLQARLDAAEKDAARLDWLQRNPGCNLISDDGKRWALSSMGMQPVPPKGGFKETTHIVSIMTPDEWRLGVRSAIDAAIEAEKQS